MMLLKTIKKYLTYPILL